MTRVIWFLRHGETDWNAEGRLQGSRDIPLNDVGRVQAEEAAAILARHAGPIDNLRFVSSPQSRAIETMELARLRLGLHARGYRIEPRLAELRFGQWEGATWEELRRNWPDEVRARQRDLWRFVPPDGESYAVLAERVAAALADIEGNAVVVAHGGTCRAMMHVLGGKSRDDAPHADIAQGAVYRFSHGEVRLLRG